MKNKTLELIHTKIHALRMMPNYKPSTFEFELNQIIAEEFKDDCAECKEKSIALKYQSKPTQGFIGGLFK